MRQGICSRAGVAWITIGWAAACAEPAPTCRPEATSRAIVGGTVDTAYPEVVLVQKGDGSTCSGVVVGARVVLTASHCVRGAAVSSLVVRTGSTDTPAGALLALEEIAIYPGATGTDTDLSGGVDLGAVLLVEDAPVRPAVLELSPLGADMNGQEVTLVGFGRDAEGGSQVRRSVTVRVKTACPRLLRAGESGATACTGDSGGAVLRDNKVIAIVSHGVQGCTGPSYHTRLDVHRAWIESVLAHEESAPCTTCVGPDEGCPALPQDAGNTECYAQPLSPE
ncbi:MAG: trypsin-like serine protease [Deltaproteobacteria bacterium]|nr:trypsin-like serine protease [Deltaproteobacteria bacterium]